jgi:putative ABC transport system permease protein
MLVVGTLALGIGSATAIFSVVNGVLLKPFPYPDADQLVVLWNANPERGQSEFRMAAPDFFELQRSNSVFSGMSLAAGATANFTGPNLPPSRVDGSVVSANFFELLGVRPLIGRTFRPEENLGDHRVVLLSHSLWTGRFGADPHITGKRIEMDGAQVEVVGVMPRIPLPIGGSDLGLPSPEVQLFWRPLNYELDWVSEIGAHVMAVMARKNPGISTSLARDEVVALSGALVERNIAPEGQEILVRPFKDQIVGDIRRPLLVLMAGVVLLLLLACGNVANLLLSRAKDRERELSVRSALGARRPRLVRQNLFETSLLAMGGGFFGLALARWETSLLVNHLPASLPRQSEIGVSASVLLFTAGISVCASLLAVLLPTVHMLRQDATIGLREGGRGSTLGRERNRTNRGIVVGQIALATVLLFGAGLLFRSLQTLKQVDPGFQAEGVTTAQLMLPDTRYGEAGQVISLYDQLRDRIGTLPGVSAVALGMDHPLENTWWNGITLLDREPPDPEETPTAIFRPVSDRYFKVMGIPVLQGRGFENDDRFDSHPVMVVNQAFVDRYFQGESPLGERIEFVVGRFIWGEEAPTVFEVVGVVGNVRFNGLRESSEPAFHIPMHQFPYQAVKLMVQHSDEGRELRGLVQDGVWAVDPDLPVADLRTMDEIIASAIAQDRFNVTLSEMFAFTALILAAAGIFGILSYTVAQRRAEFGVRMALGARASSVLALVMEEAVRLGGVGLVLGLGMALVLARSLGALVYEVPHHDLTVITVATSAVAMVALVSGLVPAWRASRADPVEVLKAD